MNMTIILLLHFLRSSNNYFDFDFFTNTPKALGPFF